ncbi:hypothetical protein EW146_g805 [Bondarzewia mesenterica]|uniref:RING-type domain-containing protein n=1 Tax=Bondarzewia mesenterica TaxID=1095465 RepID=A0A4S4M5R3_9AGAM|nr:hypothetical protein EW146_g805 [Bondarzewia mesenterica]
MSRTPSPISSNPSFPRTKYSPLSGSSSPSYRLPRTRSHARLTPRLSLDRIAEETLLEADAPINLGQETPMSMMNSSSELDSRKDRWEVSGAGKLSGTEPRRRSWNGKKGIVVGKEMKDSCGICFEPAVKPNKTRCCDQLFCFQHLSDWLSAHESDGRCPTCRVPCSLEDDTINLHPPPRLFASKRHSNSAMRVRREGLPFRSSSSPELSSSTMYDSTSSSSDSERNVARTRIAPVTQQRQQQKLWSEQSPLSPSPQQKQSEANLLRGAARALTLVGGALVLTALLCLGFALPCDISGASEFGRDAWTKRGVDLPIYRRRAAGQSGFQKRGYSGTTGLGDFADLFYTVPINIGSVQTAVNLDTGSSDLWVTSDACETAICERTNMPPYPTANLNPAGGSVSLLYGDSLTGTHANGPVGQDTASIAGLSMPQQPFAAISDTNNTSVMTSSNGILGLGFPSASQVQAAVVNTKFNNPTQTDDFILSSSSNGPLLSRLAMSGRLEQPMFTIALQRDTIDVGGQNGALTVGKLPNGVANSSLTWVPVRLYTPAEGGLNPPSFAPNEVYVLRSSQVKYRYSSFCHEQVYPLRWEILLDAVYLDGQKLPASTISANGVSSAGVSALIDTGNSLLRGPQDVVSSLLKSVSPAFTANSNADPTFSCATAHNLSFEIGGKVFPIDPRDFVSQNQTGNANTCVANNLVSTDPPSVGALFSWSLGDPFFKSNLVAFYYGNLTHPSVDPPRIGFLSQVPTNADDLLTEAVQDAKENGGNFEMTSQAPPTGVTSSISISPATVSFSPTPSLSISNTAPQASTSNAAERQKSSARISASTNFGSVGALVTAMVWVLWVVL